MNKVRAHISVSADGYVAGPNQSLENPLGEGGEGLHEWVVALRAWREPHGLEGGEVNASNRVVEEALANVGAEIMGRGKFGGGPGPWGEEWQGWWGDEPPFHVPVFVLTHHEREPLTLSDTTFTFVTDGIEAALDRARDAAGAKDVVAGGGASVINQYLAAGLVDELELHLVPLVLGGGARLFDGLGPDLQLEQVRAIEAPGVTHLKYRVVRWAIGDIDTVVAGLRARGAELVGELERYEDSYRLCYVRGPEGIIIELAEQIGYRVESVADSQS